MPDSPSEAATHHSLLKACAEVSAPVLESCIEPADRLAMFTSASPSLTSSTGAPLNTTRTAVMLSPPRPLVRARSGEMQRSSISSMMPDKAQPFFSHCGNRSLTKSTASWLPRTSQIPSQANNRNSSSASLLNVSTSGVEHMICSEGGSNGFFLYSRSPMDRERLRLPLTRYWTTDPTCCRSTEPPARRILSCSTGRFGLWSSESGTACPRRESTARLSPALATTSTSGCTRQTTHVQPTQSGLVLEGVGPTSKPTPSSSNSSMRWNAETRASRASLLGPLAISTGRCRSQKLATALPPWPSMTPKAAVLLQPSPPRVGTAKCASSIEMRHPCIQL
mmetsp:Transcript_41255/g.95518  ORF Transcript_41255/g.95518 Transcript_41255/m.95518 type:complete len:336 (-) Transcript_41255:194-1201(-)